MTNDPTPRRRKKSRAKTIGKVLLMLVASVVICAAIYAVYLTKQAEHAVTNAHEKIEGREISNKRDAKVKPIEDNISILLVGVDDSETRQQGADYSRADAIMLATLNNKEKTIKLVSIPRDSNVLIPAVGYNDKITHSHSLAGTIGTIETVEELLDVPVDYYVRMNFNAFIDVVDALDGVTVDVPYELLEKDEFDQTAVHLMPGKQLLNGSEALAFARTRKLDTDIERGKRQQELVQSILDRASSVDAVTKYTDVLRAVGDNMKTDLTFEDIKSFVYYLTKGIPHVDTISLEGYDVILPQAYYYELDQVKLQEARLTLREHLNLRNDTIEQLPFDTTNVQ